jgi:hypothetical protein
MVTRVTLLLSCATVGDDQRLLDGFLECLDLSFSLSCLAMQSSKQCNQSLASQRITVHLQRF